MEGDDDVPRRNSPKRNESVRRRPDGMGEQRVARLMQRLRKDRRESAPRESDSRSARD
jgi:hypothetical protein